MLLFPGSHPGHLACFHNVSTSPSFRKLRSSKVSMPWLSTIGLSYLWKNSSIPSKGLWQISLWGDHPRYPCLGSPPFHQRSLANLSHWGDHPRYPCLGSPPYNQRSLKTALMLACTISFLSFFTWGFFLFL